MSMEKSLSIIQDDGFIVNVFILFIERVRVMKLKSLIFKCINLTVIFTLFLSISPAGMVTLLLFALLIFALVGVLGLALAIPGFISAAVLKTKGTIQTYNQRMPNYLTLLTPTDEVQNFCPFRRKGTPGCSFLGYDAPDQPLVCDYQSTWVNCRIYAHLFHTLDEELKEVNK